MFEGMSELSAKEEILGLVKEYCETYHNVKKPFEEGQRIPYASRVYDSAEMVNLVDSSLEFWLTSGRYTDQFEKQLAKYLGVKIKDVTFEDEIYSKGQKVEVNSISSLFDEYIFSIATTKQDYEKILIM